MARTKRLKTSVERVVTYSPSWNRWIPEGYGPDQGLCDGGAKHMLRLWSFGKDGAPNSYTIKVSRVEFPGARKCRVDYVGDLAPLKLVDGVPNWMGVPDFASRVIGEVVKFPPAPGDLHPDCPNCDHEGPLQEVFVWVKATLLPRPQGCAEGRAEDSEDFSGVGL